jgi:lysophospholipase L1-like esterase
LFIRTDSSFLDARGKPKTELFIDDKLHLNKQGYAIWAEIIKDVLYKIVPIKN